MAHHNWSALKEALTACLSQGFPKVFFFFFPNLRKGGELSMIGVVPAPVAIVNFTFFFCAGPPC